MAKTLLHFIIASAWMTICLLMSASTEVTSSSTFQKQFTESFIKHYEFNAEGRYAHEYHPFLLEYTANSFSKLEESLTQAGMTLNGRYVILGYEENAVPSYYTNYQEAKIEDEASIKNRAGWSLRLHNRFGFMTGFLFKNAYKIPPPKDQVPFFDHLDAQSVKLFDPRATIFQEHAFGEALPLMRKTQKLVEQQIVDHNPLQALGTVKNFWHTLYRQAFKVGNQQIAGTQDILFSVAYLDYILASKTPLKQCFIGPDITYPIEIFSKQEKIVTRHAQGFIKQLARLLKPIDETKTVYIFGSFVDGVGKSTMLGNLKNWMAFGDDVEKFIHVDNSSSQLVDLFQFAPDVFIADLPAQMSHFTYKPDGMVYVDALTEYKMSDLEPVEAFVKEHQKDLVTQYDDLLANVHTIIKNEGFLSTTLEDPDHPELTFVRNVILLKKETSNKWIPFVFNGTSYLFDRYNPSCINILTSLAHVKSEGLKNIQSEQMLFYAGVRFPFPYQQFITDLVTRFQEQGIKRVMFVDFLSMYPRSSRENIRVNYLLQQMALLDKNFNVSQSLYRDFVSEGELLYMLCNNQGAQQITQAFQLEATTRMLLYTAIIARQYGDLDGQSLSKLTQQLGSAYRALDADFLKASSLAAAKKVRQEKEKMELAYGMSKSFVNLQNSSLHDVATLSSLIQQIMYKVIKHERINKLWKPMAPILPEEENKHADGFIDIPVKLSDGQFMHGSFKVSLESKDEVMLAPIHQIIRVCWYVALANLVFTMVQSDDTLMLTEEFFAIPALIIQATAAGNLFTLQPILPAYDGVWPTRLDPLFALFTIPRRSVYIGLCEQLAYCLEWDNLPTNHHIFSYGCHRTLHGQQDINGQSSDIPLVSTLVRNHQKTRGLDQTITAAQLVDQIKTSSGWQTYQRDIASQAAKTGPLPENATINQLIQDIIWTQAAEGQRSQAKRKIYLGRPEQRSGARLFVRLIATIDMLLKDPNGHIVIRRGNRDDFRAAVWMLEKITLPKYLGVYFSHHLFDDYAAVEPYPSWEFWKMQS